MPQVEKTIHLDVYALYMKMGGMSPEFLSAFEKKTGKSEKTAYRWEKDYDWKARAREPINEAVQELEENGKLDAQELISGFLDMCKNRIDDIADKTSYINAVFGTAFERIPNAKNPKPKNPIVVDSIEDMERLANMQVKLIKAEIELAKLSMILVGEPDSRAAVIGSVAEAILNGNYYSKS